MIDNRGIHPLPENVAAIQHMATPTNISKLRSFLGAINFYGNFIVNIQQHCAPLHDLLRNNTKWSWTPQHDVIFKKLKNIISTTDTLVHYDSTLPLVLCTDASDVGVSAVLMQRFNDNAFKPISASSRRLIDAERNNRPSTKKRWRLFTESTNINNICTVADSQSGPTINRLNTF